MKYISVKEAAQLWNLSERSVRNYCSDGRVDGAFLTGKTWNIPENAVKPVRINTAKHIPVTLILIKKLLIVLSIIGIIIIGAVVLAISSGNLILPVEKTEAFIADSFENYPTKLCISGNKLIDENGNEIVLKGLMAPDPQKIFSDGNFISPRNSVRKQGKPSPTSF